MALKVIDRAKETTTGTGTGNLALDGPATGFQSLPVGFEIYYCIDGESEWEVGYGSVNDYGDGPVLTRSNVLASSASGAKVNFAAGSKEVFCCHPAKVIDDLMRAADTLGGSAVQILNDSVEFSGVDTWPASDTITLRPVIDAPQLCPVYYAAFDVTIIARSSASSAPAKIWEGKVFYGTVLGDETSVSVVAGTSVAYDVSVSATADDVEGGGTDGVQVNIDCTLNSGSSGYFEATAIMRVYDSPSCW